MVTVAGWGVVPRYTKALQKLWFFGDIFKFNKNGGRVLGVTARETIHVASGAWKPTDGCPRTELRING